MSATVPLIAPKVTLDPAQSGKPVSGSSTWQQLALLANYCNGRGGTLIPAYYPGNTITAGTDGTYRYMVFPVYAALTRMWVVRAHSVSSTAETTVTLTAPSGGAYTVSATLSSDINATSPLTLFETIGARASVAQEITLNIAAAGQDAIIDQIACYEVPRTALDPAASPAEYGVELESLRGGQPIIDQLRAGVDYKSVTGVAEAMRYYRMQNGPKTHPNRMLFCWAVPDNDPWITTSASHVAITQLPVPYLTKRSRVKAKAPSSNVRFHYYAMVNANQGHFSHRFGDAENISGATYQNLGVVNTSFQWADDVRSTSSALEDLDQPDGRFDDSGTPKWSEMQFAAKVITATNVQISSICVFDEDT
jgi:hypothetical protein